MRAGVLLGACGWASIALLCVLSPLGPLPGAPGPWRSASLFVLFLLNGPPVAAGLTVGALASGGEAAATARLATVASVLFAVPYWWYLGARWGAYRRSLRGREETAALAVHLAQRPRPEGEADDRR